MKHNKPTEADKRWWHNQILATVLDLEAQERGDLEYWDRQDHE